MGFDLYSIDYLKSGSPRQLRAYEALREIDIIGKILSWYEEDPGPGETPVLAGSVPLDLALDESDLDIVTCSSDLRAFAAQLREAFGGHEEFQSSRGIVLGVATLITKFKFAGEVFEIFTQAVPVPMQNAVVHMMVEERLLMLGGAGFREKIWAERRKGLKTEPAFGAVLGLEEPYRELLTFEDLSDHELRARFF